MKKHFTVFFMLFIFVFFRANSQAEAMPEKTAQPMTPFSALDTNSDGVVSKEEFFARYPTMKDAAFTAIDKNKDGFISEEEWNAFFVDHSKETDGSGSVTPAEQRDGGMMPPKNSKESKEPKGPKLMMPDEGSK